MSTQSTTVTREKNSAERRAERRHPEGVVDRDAVLGAIIGGLLNAVTFGALERDFEA